jgi:hypothetical protein
VASNAFIASFLPPLALAGLSLYGLWQAGLVLATALVLVGCRHLPAHQLLSAKARWKSAGSVGLALLLLSWAWL